MALEQVFGCPKTLSRLRSGPLGKFLDGFCNWLLDRGFRRGTIRKHLFNVSHLNEHLGGLKGELCECLSPKDIDDFFNAYPLRCRRRATLEGHIRRLRYSVNRFLDYLRDLGFLILHPGRRSISPFWMHISSGCAITSMLRREHSMFGAIRH